MTKRTLTAEEIDALYEIVDYDPIIAQAKRVPDLELVRDGLEEMYRDKIADLRRALVVAREDLVEWGGYADDYFKEKHDYAGALTRIDVALAAVGLPVED